MTERKRGAFVNFSNHPSEKWSAEQRAAAGAWGDPIVDEPFPEVDPRAGEEEIGELADVCVKRILAGNPSAVMCQGEFTLSYQVICRLKEHGIPVLAACSRREVQERDGVRISMFSFVRFREYGG